MLRDEMKLESIKRLLYFIRQQELLEVGRIVLVEVIHHVSDAVCTRVLIACHCDYLIKPYLHARR